MRRLILMRHAKSSWTNPDLADHERPLNRRGKRSATAMGDWLRDLGYLPDEALVSTSLRTRQTFDLLRQSCPASFLDSLYHASFTQILACLQSATAPTVLIIGHNPGFAEFAERIVTVAPTHSRFHDFPTAATLVADLEINTWADATWGMADVRDFAVPRDWLA